MKRKNWYFSLFIIGLILLLIWIIILFTDTTEKDQFQKIFQWVMLFWYILMPISFYLGYKNEVKRENTSQNNKSDV